MAAFEDAHGVLFVSPMPRSGRGELVAWVGAESRHGDRVERRGEPTRPSCPSGRGCHDGGEQLSADIGAGTEHRDQGGGGRGDERVDVVDKSAKSSPRWWTRLVLLVPFQAMSGCR